MALAILGVVYPIDLSNAATPPRVLADQHDRYGREHRSLRETAKYLPWRVWRCRKTLTAAAFFPVVASTRAQLPLSVGLPGSLSRARIHHHQGLHITENPSASGSFEPGNQKEQRDP